MSVVVLALAVLLGWGAVVAVNGGGPDTQTASLARARSATSAALQPSGRAKPSGGIAGVAHKRRYPVQWPFAGAVRISDGFGPRVRPCALCSNFHRGTDFLPGEGQPVYAIADGVVRDVEQGGGLGVHVVIAHRIDLSLVTSTYAHMQVGSVQVRDGQTVKEGELVGRVGNTGWSTGPHLHFELRLGGTDAIDAYPWLRSHAGSTAGAGTGGTAGQVPSGDPGTTATGKPPTDWAYLPPHRTAGEDPGELIGLSASQSSSADDQPVTPTCGGTSFRLIGRLHDVTAVLVGATRVAADRTDHNHFVFTAPPAPPGPATVTAESPQGLLLGSATVTYVEDLTCTTPSPSPGESSPPPPPWDPTNGTGTGTGTSPTPSPSPSPTTGTTPSPSPTPSPTTGTGTGTDPTRGESPPPAENLPPSQAPGG